MPQVYEASKFYFTVLAKDDLIKVLTKPAGTLQRNQLISRKSLPPQKNKHQCGDAQQEGVIHVTNDFKCSHFLLRNGNSRQ